MCVCVCVCVCVYVCVCVCLFVCILHVHVLCVLCIILYIQAHTYTYTHVHTNTCVECTHTYTYIHIHIYIQSGADVVKAHYMNNPSFTLAECGKACPGSEKLYQWIAGVLTYLEKNRESVGPIKVCIVEWVCMHVCIGDIVSVDCWCADVLGKEQRISRPD